MIEIQKCLGYINDFKLYSKWTGEINKAIAYRKLKTALWQHHFSQGLFSAQDLLFSLPEPGMWDRSSPHFPTLQVARGSSHIGLTLGPSTCERQWPQGGEEWPRAPRGRWWCLVAGGHLWGLGQGLHFARFRDWKKENLTSSLSLLLQRPPDHPSQQLGFILPHGWSGYWAPTWLIPALQGNKIHPKKTCCLFCLLQDSAHPLLRPVCVFVYAYMYEFVCARHCNASSAAAFIFSVLSQLAALLPKMEWTEDTNGNRG